jgi:hypothetical protein
MEGDRVSGDAEVDSFVAANLVSFPAWDLIVYLHRNPDGDSTMPELCNALARPEREVEPALRMCVANGVAQEHVGDDGLTRFHLTRESAMQGLLSRFVELAGVREIRLEFVRAVMSRLAN